MATATFRHSTDPYIGIEQTSSHDSSKDLLTPSPSAPIITSTPDIICCRSYIDLEPASEEPIIRILLFFNFFMTDKTLFVSSNDYPCNPPEAVLWTKGDISHELDFFLIIKLAPAALDVLIHEPRFLGS